MGVAYVRFAVAHPSHYRVMFGADIQDGADIREDANPELAQEGAGSFQVLVDAITALQEQDLARRDDPQQMALFVWAAVHGVAMLAIDGRLGDTQLSTECRDALTRLRDSMRTFRSRESHRRHSVTSRADPEGDRRARREERTRAGAGTRRRRREMAAR